MPGLGSFLPGFQACLNGTPGFRPGGHTNRRLYGRESQKAPRAAPREAELSDKDRIIGTEVLCVEIRLRLPPEGGPVAAGDALNGGPADVI